MNDIAPDTETLPHDPATLASRLSVFVQAGVNTMPAIRAMLLVHNESRATITRIAEHVEVSTASATSIADKLETRGLAQRQRSPIDRRVVFVVLTSHGLELIQKATA